MREESQYQEVEDAITRASAPLIHVMNVRDRRFKRIMYFLTVISVVTVITLLFILSVVKSGVPILRVYEKNQEQSGRIIAELNRNDICQTSWFNKRYVSGCDDIYAALDSREIAPR